MEPTPPTRLRRDRTGPTASGAAAGTSIVLIDGRPVIRECFSQWLEGNAREVGVSAFASVADVLGDSRDAKEAHLIMYSIGAARVSDPEVLDNIRQLSQALPNTPVALLSDRDD